eukprot:14338237-Ditylum_brightwellii.AAC.1
MSFGLDKYVILLITNAKYSTTNIYPEIPKLDNADYQSIMEWVDFHMGKVKALTIKEYFQYVRKILNVDMNEDYTMTSISAYAIPVLIYSVWNHEVDER